MTATGRWSLAGDALSMSDGVKLIDAAWLSDLRESTALSGQLLVQAPEICVEVLSPSNTPAEMAEKTALYFDAGVDEVWLCENDGTMRFQTPAAPVERSVLCPDFPGSIPGRISILDSCPLVCDSCG